MAVRQTVVATNGARQNLVPTLCGRGGEGGPCAGRPMQDRHGHFEVLGCACPKSTGKPAEFITVVNIMHQIHGIVLNLPSPNLKNVHHSRSGCALSSDLEIPTCYFGSWLYLFWKIAPIINKVVLTRKNVGSVKEPAPIANALAPNSKCLLKWRSLLPQTTYANCEENPPRNKGNGCGSQASCWSTEKVFLMVKRVLLP